MGFGKYLKCHGHDFANLDVDSPVVDHKQSFELGHDQIGAHSVVIDKRLKGEYFRQVVIVIVHDLDQLTDILLAFDVL